MNRSSMAGIRLLKRLGPEGRIYSPKRISSFITARLYWFVEVFMERVFNCRFSIDYSIVKTFNLHSFGYYSYQIIVKDDGHQQDKKEKTYLLGHLPLFDTDGFFYYHFYQKEKDHPAIQNWYR